MNSHPPVRHNRRSISPRRDPGSLATLHHGAMDLDEIDLLHIQIGYLFARNASRQILI